MAMYAYREQGRKRGVTKPNIVICRSAHSAFEKAAFYLNLRVKVVGQDKDYKMDVRQTRRAVDSDTIAIVASAPNFSSGIVDDIEALSDVASEANVGMHVDCCLGGFVIAFAEKIKLEQKE